MSQHSQRTQDGPTTRSIVIGALMVAGSMAGTLYVIGGPGINGRELVASLMGAALIGFTVAHTMSLMVERAVVRDRAERAAEREQRERTERARIEAERADAPPLAPPMYPEERYEEPRYEDRPEPEPPYAPEDEGPVVYPSPSPDATRAWLRDPEEAAVYAEPPGPPVEPWGPAEQRAAAVLDRVVAENTGGYPVAEPPYEPARTPGSWNAFQTPGARRAALERVPMPLPPRDGYVDPGPYSSFVPVSPGRTTGGYELDCDGSCRDEGCPAYVDRRDYPGSWSGADTEVISRVPDGAVTEVIERVQ